MNPQRRELGEDMSIDQVVRWDGLRDEARPVGQEDETADGPAVEVTDCDSDRPGGLCFNPAIVCDLDAYRVADVEARNMGHIPARAVGELRGHDELLRPAGIGGEPFG